jgi:hypothetical protein
MTRGLLVITAIFRFGHIEKVLEKSPEVFGGAMGFKDEITGFLVDSWQCSG